MGSGKTTLGLLLKKRGFSFVSADNLVKKAVAPGGPGHTKLLKLLGGEFLQPNGCFDTRKTAEIAFQNPTLLKHIERIIHPIVRDLMQKQDKKLSAEGKKAVFYEIPLLFEKKWESFFHTRIVIAVHREKQYARLKQSRNWSGEEIRWRMRFQMPQEEKIKRADHLIWNNGSLKDLEKQLAGLPDLLGI